MLISNYILETIVKNYIHFYNKNNYFNVKYLINECKNINKYHLIKKKILISPCCGLIIFNFSLRLRVIKKNTYIFCFCFKFKRILNKNLFLKYFIYE